MGENRFITDIDCFHNYFIYFLAFYLFTWTVKFQKPHKY